MSIHLDHNVIGLYDIGHIDKVGERCGSGIVRGPKRYLVHTGWSLPDAWNMRTGTYKRTWTRRGADRVASKARRDPANAEDVSRESRRRITLGTMLPGESRTFTVSKETS